MAVEQHHHRSTTKTPQKPFKSKHLSKGAIKDKLKGKVESLDRGARKTPHQQVMSKLDRRNQAKQKRVAHNADHTKASGIFTGKNAASRHVVLVPLSEGIDCADAVRKLVQSVDIEDDVPQSGAFRAEISRFKQSLQFLIPRSRNVWELLDLCRIADYVTFVMSADEEVDDLGVSTLKTIESQGISTVLSLVQGLGTDGTQKKQHQVQASLRSFITHFFPSQDKVLSLDNRQECLNTVRSLCSTLPKGIKWREDRSWLYVEDVKWATTNQSSFSVTGVVRGRGLKPDRLLEVGDWGTFQISRIQAVPLASRRKGHSSSHAIAGDVTDTLLDQPSADADNTDDLAPEEALMTDAPYTSPSVARSDRKGVLLDDHHYFDDEDEDRPAMPKRLPKGTSNYQAAWYLGDMSDSGSDLEDADDDVDMTAGHKPIPADGLEGLDANMPDATEGAPSEYPQSEMFLDPSPEDEADQLAQYRATRKDEAADDLEFPDEIELHPNALARERLARYRGLKSLRTSAWDTDEDKPYEPEEWRRLLEIANYKAAKNRYTNEALAGGVTPGTRVEVQLTVGDRRIEDLKALAHPIGAFSLLRHEQKRTVMNYSINLSSEHESPLKSKQELIMQCGSRRTVIKPLFSQSGHTPNNVHKFDRYLHPGQTATATVIAPLTWGSVPVLFFVAPSRADTSSDSASTPASPRLIATGTTLPPSMDRVIAKRAILTGHPYKIHKRLVTVRYMFFNREDVEWFRALQLWTRRGRSGFVKEALGTHGYFKATFDGKINPLDAVAVSLYKRVWPRPAERYIPEKAHAGDNGMAAEVEMHGAGA